MRLQTCKIVMLRNAFAIAILIAATLMSVAYGDNPPPTVLSISPSSGPINGGTATTITGTNFLSGATVTFGSNVAIDATVVSSTIITATSPANSAGAVNITVSNPDGQAGTLWALQQPLSNPGFESGVTA
jgi:hypothetical protein